MTDPRDASVSNTAAPSVHCIARAQNSALPPALRCGKRGANSTRPS
jgi:hypothetical protein